MPALPAARTSVTAPGAACATAGTIAAKMRARRAICRGGRAIAQVVGRPRAVCSVRAREDPAREPGHGPRRCGARRAGARARAGRARPRGRGLGRRRARSTPNCAPAASSCPSAAARRSGVVEWTAREAAFVRAFRPHVVHAHNTKATVIAAAAVRLGRGPRRPPVLATHHGAAQEDRAARPRAARPRRRRGRRRLRGPAVRRRARDPQRRRAARRRPARRRRRRSAFVGRLVEVKNPERFLRAAALVDGARFLVVGDGPLRAQLEALAAELRLDVTFTGARPGRPRR